MHPLCIAWSLITANDSLESLLLLRSLRSFGGELAEMPAYIFLPDHAEAMTQATNHSLEEMGASLVKFYLPPEARGFPFAVKVHAAAAAEALLQDAAARLAWLDADTVVLNPPRAFLLPIEKKLGCCPVHHRLVGSPAAQPPDEFWQLIFANCGVLPGRDFEVTTVIGSERIRPYWNAGALVVRPELGMLRLWEETFTRLYQDPRVSMFYERDPRYQIFIHQAILAGVSLACFSPDEFEVFPPTYNYPLHLVHQAQPGELPAALEALVTCRYEDIHFLSEGKWQDLLPARQAWDIWLNKALGG